MNGRAYQIYSALLPSARSQASVGFFLVIFFFWSLFHRCFSSSLVLDISQLCDLFVLSALSPCLSASSPDDALDVVGFPESRFWIAL